MGCASSKPEEGPNLSLKRTTLEVYTMLFPSDLGSDALHAHEKAVFGTDGVVFGGWGGYAI